jgi:uncharacterized membrane protein YeaQ/YmgE (transglycosylase-associated protein family)
MPCRRQLETSAQFLDLRFDSANEDNMQPLIWMSLGAVIGWTSGRALQDGGYDWFRDVVMGIGGMVVGGLLGISDGSGGYRGSIVTTMIALMAATLLMMLVKRASSGWSYARSVQATRLETRRPTRYISSVPTPQVNASKLRFAWSPR